MSEKYASPEIYSLPAVELGEALGSAEIIEVTQALEAENVQVLGNSKTSAFSPRVKMMLANVALVTLMACSSGRATSGTAPIPLESFTANSALYNDTEVRTTYDDANVDIPTEVNVEPSTKASSEQLGPSEYSDADVSMTSRFETVSSGKPNPPVNSASNPGVPSGENIDTNNGNGTPTLGESTNPTGAGSSEFTGESEEIQNPVIAELQKKYVRATMEETLELARTLDFIPNSEYEHPSNMCGPLAASIMRDLGAIPPGTEIDITKFWLATPAYLNSLLPPDSYSSEYYAGSIADFDPVTIPLHVGDFLYLSGGDFDHMITISEIDAQGRYHAITNVEQLDHTFAVEDVILYDPVNPDEDMFDWWANNTKVGKTGVLGMYVWHLE